MYHYPRNSTTVICCAAIAMTLAAAGVGYAQGPAAPTMPSVAADTKSMATSSAPPADYVIGPEDQLTVVFFHDKDMSADVVVRPDGKISLPLLNEVQASGLTPEQLREKVSEVAKQFIQDPKATILVRQINSRKVFITGAVEKPGNYPLFGPTTALQLIAIAGGVKEYADSKKIIIIRNEGGSPVTYRFNYKEIVGQMNMKQNIELRPGDTIVVP
jgi:polysaccharide biosynthesis/export protein